MSDAWQLEASGTPAAAQDYDTAAQAPALPTGEDGHLTHGLLPPSHWTHLAEEQSDRDDDQDSGVGDNNSSTQTLLASIRDYQELHGRTYHSVSLPGDGNAQYWGSNDEDQNESMNFNHAYLTLCCENKLHFAPLDTDRIQKVIDIGTGTGIWAVEFADEHQNIEVIGTDISPIQPDYVPPNLKFEIDDCLSSWTFTEETVDYVHIRYLVGSVINWTAFFKEAYRALKPGGWLESLEGSPHMISDDGSVPDDSAMSQWGRFFEEGGKAMGRTFMVVEQGIQRKAMEEAGFVDIEEWNFKAPIGSWPKNPDLKEMGIRGQAALEADIEGYILFIANQIAGWSREEILVYIACLRREIRSAKHHAYFKLKAVWGRKPFSTA